MRCEIGQLDSARRNEHRVRPSEIRIDASEGKFARPDERAPVERMAAEGDM